MLAKLTSIRLLGGMPALFALLVHSNLWWFRKANLTHHLFKAFFELEEREDSTLHCLWGQWLRMLWCVLTHELHLRSTSPCHLPFGREFATAEHAVIGMLWEVLVSGIGMTRCFGMCHSVRCEMTKTWMELYNVLSMLSCTCVESCQQLLYRSI